MEKILSLIIPTYNMEKYLNKCLDSLIVDNMDLVEVLVINDGSKDRSSEIAHEYEKKYPNTFRVIDKENGNYGSCINRGLKEATGKYIKVLDADDYFDSGTLMLVLQRLTSVDTDAVLTNFNIVKDNKIEPCCLSYDDECVVDANYAIVKYFGMHNVIYKHSLLKEMSYTQTEGISYTDQEWIFYPMLKARTVKFFDLYLYQYVLGREGQTMNLKTLYRNIWMIENLIMQMLARLKDSKNKIPNCKQKYAENVLKIQIRLIYEVELLQQKKKNCNVKFLREMEKELLSYNIDFYKIFDNQTVNLIPYVKYFRKGILLSTVFRLIILLSHEMKNKSKRLREKLRLK